MVIFCIDASSNKLENEPPFINPDYSIISRTVLNSAGNIMLSYLSHKVSRSLSEYIPLVSDSKLIYFQGHWFEYDGGKISTGVN